MKPRLWLALVALAALPAMSGAAFAGSTVNSLPVVPTFPFPDSGCAADSTQNVWMSQGAGSGNDYRATLNQVDPLYIGTSAPSCPYKWEFWGNGTTGYLQLYNGAAWVRIGGLDASGLWVPPVAGGAAATLVAASTTDLGSVPQANISLTGNTTITSFGSSAAIGQHKFVTVANTPTLTYNSATLVLPSRANIVATAGDTFETVYRGSGVWTVIAYQPSGGSSLIPVTSGQIIAALGYTPMSPANNLSDVASIAAARGNLIPAGTITGAQLAAGAALSNLGYTPMNPLNNLGDVSNSATSRTNLGLGTMAVQSASNVNITGGNLTGIGTLIAGGGDFTTGLTVSTVFNATGLVTNADLVNASMTIAGHSIALGGTQAIAAADLSNGVSGSGAVVLATGATLASATLTSATLTTPNLGTPSAVTLTNGTGLPIAGITGLGTGVGTALAASVTGSGGIVLASGPTFTGATTFPGSTAIDGSGNLTASHTVSLPGISLGTTANQFVCIFNAGGSLTGSPTTCVTSDARLKTNWGESPGLAAVLQLRPGTFDWRDVVQAREGRQVGLAAQEVRAIIPDLVSVGGDRTITLSDGSKETIHDTEAVDYAKLVVPLIKAVQELQAEIDMLRGRP